MKKKNNKNLMILCAIFSIFLGGMGFAITSVSKVYASEQTEIITTAASQTNGKYLTYSDTSKCDRDYYSLADEYMFFVENQNRSGLCWDFSVCTMIENYLAMKTGELYDLSEAWVALAYKMYNSNYVIGAGGNIMKFMNAVVDYGLMFEDEFPFDYIYNIDDSNYKQVFNQYKDLAHKDLLNNPKYVTFYTGDFGNLETKVEYVKKYITNYGALNISYCDSDRVMRKGIAYACGTQLNANHAVTIIGWDDNATFVDNKGVSHTGVYIIQNSWGIEDESNLIYISYDDQCSNYTIFGITESQDTGEINLSSSNALVKNYAVNKTHIGGSVTTDDFKEQNIFYYGQSINLSYEATGDYANNLLSVDVKRNGVSEKSTFDVFNVSSSGLNISTNKPIDSGNYRLQFNIDLNNDRVADKVVIKQFTVLSGAEMELCIVRGSNDNLYENCNKVVSAEEENNIYGYTYNSSINYYLYFGTYSQITDISLEGASISMSKPSNLQFATNSNYSTTYVLIRINTNYQQGEIVNRVIISTLSGAKVKYNLITYGMTSEDKRAYVFYSVKDGNNDVKISSNMHSYIAVGDNFDQELSAPTNLKAGRVVDGYYQDSTFATPIVSLSSSVQSMSKTNYFDKSTSANKYVLFVYVKWKTAELSISNQSISAVYGQTSNLTFTGATGGSENIVYSIVSSTLPSYVQLDLNSLRLLFNTTQVLNVGEYSINLLATDSDTGASGTAIKKIVVTPRDVTYKIDDKKTNFGDDVLALTGKVTRGTVLNGDDLQITLSCEVTKQSGIGSYEITGVANNSNYNVTFVNGTYYVVEKEILFTIDSYEDQYDGLNHGITINLQNNISVEIEYKLQGGVYSTTPISFKDFTGGKQTIYVRLSSPNYASIESQGTVNILKREIQVSWANLSFTYNKTPQKPTAVVLSNTYGKVVDLVVSGEKINAGNYTATVSTTNANFKITNPSKAFVINKAEPTVDTSNITFSKEDLNKAQKLGDLPLPEGYSWNNPDQEIGEGENTYYITYTPQDTENYNNVDDIEIVIKRATKEQRYFFIMILGLGIAIFLAVIIMSIVKLQRYAYERSVLDKPQKVKTHKPKGDKVLITFVTNAPFSIAPVETSKRIAIKLPTPERSSYKFAGWYTDKIFMHPYENNGVENMLTLYAKWQPKD